ncbi:glycosyltransferase [Cognatishimia activa]|nr:glycosyltransferase [Cognatishimia activa]
MKRWKPMTPAISVIIPVYNVAAYVGDCITSLRRQTFSDFEAIVVDDESADASVQAALDAIGEDRRFRLIEQNHGGLSVARNKGLNLARGQHISFIDSDDMVAPDFLEKLKSSLDVSNADWVACAIQFKFPDGTGRAHSAIHGDAELFNHKVPRRYQFRSSTDVIRHFPSAWNKLYRRTFIGDLRFEEGKQFEDHLFFHQLAARTDHIMHLPEPLYVQTKGRSGQITGQDDDRVFEQLEVLESLRLVLEESPHGDGKLAFERLASRLVFERSTAIKNTTRRFNFAKASAAFFDDNNLIFSPDWDPDIARSWGMEMAGELPVSIVIPWNGRDLAAMRSTLRSIAQLQGPQREVLVVCKDDQAVRRCRQEFSGIVILQDRARRKSAARALGLKKAQGQYVVFLNAGDSLDPVTLLHWSETMLRDDADMGVAGHRRTNDHSAFKSRRKPPFEPLAKGVATALGLDPCLSSKIFRRNALLKWLGPGLQTFPDEIPIILNAAIALSSTHIEGSHVTVAPLKPPSPRHLLRLFFFSRAITSKVDKGLHAELPAGWQRRLFARLLRIEIDRIKARSMPTRIAWLTLLAITTFLKGFAGPIPNPAGFDVDFSPRKMMVFDPVGALRHLLGRPRPFPFAQRQAQLDTKIQQGSQNCQNRRSMYFPLSAQALFRCRISFEAHEYANINFASKEQLSIPFHLSFRFKEQTLVFNRRNKAGVWSREKPINLPLKKSGCDVEIRFNGKHVSCLVDKEKVLRRRWCANKAAVSQVDLQGGIRPIALYPDLQSRTLALDQRLHLIADEVPACSTIQIRHFVDRLPLEVCDPQDIDGKNAAHLPGRLWRGLRTKEPLHLQVLDASGRPVGAPLLISRDEMQQRLEMILTVPVSASDCTLAICILEHLWHGEFFNKLSPAAQTQALRIAKCYDLTSLLPFAMENIGPQRLASPPNSEQTAIATALARIAAAPSAVDPIEVLAQLPIAKSATAHLYLSLVEFFCSKDRDFERFFEFTVQKGIAPAVDPTTADNLWELSASLPFYYLDRRYEDLSTALGRIASDTKHDWIVTTALAWIIRKLIDDKTLKSEFRFELLHGILGVLDARRLDYFSRIHCVELTNACATLIQNISRISPTQRPEVIQTCLRSYGLSRQFWAHVDLQNQNLPDAVRHAGQDFRDMERALTDPASESTADSEFALNAFDTIGCADANRFRRDLFGPTESGLISKVGTTENAVLACHPNSAQAALRALAHPLGPAVTGAFSNFAKEGFDQITTNSGELPETLEGVSDDAHSSLDGIVVIFSCQKNLNSHLPALRESWVKDLDRYGIPYIVIVGDGNGTREGDTVFLDAPDDYDGLPAKMLAAIRWVRDTTEHRFLYKIDDDCFLNVEQFIKTFRGRDFDYVGRPLRREPGDTDRAWHQIKSSSDRGRFEFDKSVEPSVYADGGSGYALSRRAMTAALDVADSPDGLKLLQISFMEDKLLGDLLALQGIELQSSGYHSAIYRRMTAQGKPVAHWHNNFTPSKTAPVLQVHLDSHEPLPQLMVQKEKHGLRPKKIWPSYQNAQLGYQSNALEMVSSKNSAKRARDSEVAVVSCMRNEMFMLPHFMRHYRGLGVDSFLIADNNSDDGTLEYLLEQDDVTAFTVDTDYNHSHYGVAWQQAMISAFRVGKWSLVADTDELFFWQKERDQCLPGLLKTSAFAEAEAMRIFMLDMYPKYALSETHFASGSPFDEARYCDAHPFLTNWPGRGVFSDQTTWTSAVRHRLIPNTRPDLFVAQKIALLRYQPWMRLSAGLHFVGDAKLATTEAFFGHFKYHADFRRKAAAEAARKQHFNSAEEYENYRALISEGRDQVYEPDLSVHWTDCRFVQERLT